MTPSAPASADLALLEDEEQLSAFLSPKRREMLAALQATPDSAAGLAAKLGSTRQKVNYHLRSLEGAGLVELAEERQRRGFKERVLRPTARAYMISPEVVGDLGLDPEDIRDRFSSRYLVAMAQRMVRDVTELAKRARAARKKLPSFTLAVDVRFHSAADRNAFAERVSQATLELAREYESKAAKRPGPKRAFRFVFAGHPILEQTSGDLRADPAGD